MAVALAGLLGLAGVVRQAAAQQTADSAITWAAENEVFYQILVRSFRDSDGDRIGDLRGVEEELDYLHDLGVTSLLLTPVNPSPFYHNYFATSFAGVDPAYGDTTSLRRLVEAVHARGMKIYLDQEIQYAAQDNPWWAQSRGQPGSGYGRYILYHGPGNTQPEPGVFGLSALPTWTGANIRIATVNLLDSAVVSYFQTLFASLADPNHDGRWDDGVDGFRIDHMMDDLDGKGVLKNLFAQFWAPVFAAARAANPRVKVIAEQADWGFGDDWLTRGGADLVYAFPICRAVDSLSRTGIADAIAQTLRRTPAHKGQLIFIENHDMSRFATVVGGDPRKERVGAALGVLLKGTPLIYYGQEIGMKGRQSSAWGSDANDIPVREAFKWTRNVEDSGSAIWYRGSGAWWTNRFNRDGDGISVAEERSDSNSLLSFYRRLLALRRSRPDILHGDERVVATDQPEVLAIVRSTPEAASLLLVNLSDRPVTALVARDSLPASLGSSLRDLIANRPVPGSRTTLRVPLEPFGIWLLGSGRLIRGA
jgi:glycosidase